MPRSQSDITSKIDPESIADFLLDVWCAHDEAAGDFYAFICWKNNQGWHQRAIHSEEPLWDTLLRLIKKHSGDDLYFCPNLFREPNRLKCYAHPTRWAWCDIDDGDYTPSPPSILWETSPGRYQGLWLLDKDYPLKDAELLSKAIAKTCSDDGSGWDISKVLRMPGTWNYKRARPTKVTLIDADWERPCTIPQVIADQVEKLSNADGAPTPRQHRGNEGPLDFDAVRVRYVPAHMRQHIRKVINGDRSGTYWALARSMREERGASDAQIECIVRASFAFRDKFRDRSSRAADAEISRILEKLR